MERVFEENLTRIGNVVAIFDKWDGPRYLTRIWTIFEQFIAIKLNVPVTIVLPRTACESLIKEFNRGEYGIKKVTTALLKIESQNAEASVPTDEQKVKKMITDTVGFEDLDGKISNFMTEWIAGEVQSHMKRLVTMSNTKLADAGSGSSSTGG